MAREEKRIARIYQPCKSAMQSGKAKTQSWVLEYQFMDRAKENIMGWNTSGDVYAQEVRLFFNSKEEAIAYATSNDIDFNVIEPQLKKVIRPRPYVKNYA